MLERAQRPSVITTMRKAQISWAGHVFRMSDSRIPKKLLYGELSQGARKVGEQRKRFKDSLKAYLKDFNIDITTWENVASDRPVWRSMIHKGALHSEVQRSNAAKEKRLVPDLWQGLPCPHRSHQPPADTPRNVLKCRLTWSYS